MFCPKCGANIADGSATCPQCGAQVTPQPAASSPGFPTPPATPTQPAPYPANAYGQTYGQQPYGQPLPGAQTDGKATTSLVLGILSLTCLGILAGIPAIILGHMSRTSIRESMGRLKGDGLALAGLIMGYISVAMIPMILIIAAIAIPNLIRSRIAANEASAVGSIRTVNTAEITYQATYPNQGFAPDLATLGGSCSSGDNGTAEHACLIDHLLGDSTCTGDQWCTKSGYKFVVQADSAEPHKAYTVTAIPAVPNQTGNRAFCSTEDGIIRMDSAASHRTEPYTAEECKNLTML